MSDNYYNELNLDIRATQEEIEHACDAIYNKTRRLITHHDPKVAQEASRKMLLLDEIRETLLVPEARHRYDQGLMVGGLTTGDGSPAPRQFRQTPPTPSKKTTTADRSKERIDAWLCPQCQTANTIGHHFCLQCGYAIRRECPACRTAMDTTAQFCPNCGINIENEILRQTTTAQLHQAREIHDRLLSNDPHDRLKRPVGLASRVSIASIAWALFAVIGFISYLFGWHRPPYGLFEYSTTHLIVAGAALGLLAIVSLLYRRLALSSLIALALMAFILAAPSIAQTIELAGVEPLLPQFAQIVLTTIYISANLIAGGLVFFLTLSLVKQGCLSLLQLLIILLGLTVALVPHLHLPFYAELAAQQQVPPLPPFLTSTLALLLGYIGYGGAAVLLALMGIQAWHQRSRALYELQKTTFERRQTLEEKALLISQLEKNLTSLASH